MLGKLIKYDMRSMIRVFAPLWLLAPIVALLLSFTMRGAIVQSDYSLFSANFGNMTGILVLVMSLMFFGVMVALVVMTVLLVIQRFWRGLLKEEGYLMFTLPVEPWKLITSKGITATIVCLISGLVGVLSCILLFLGSAKGVMREFGQLWGFFLDNVNRELGAALWVDLILFILLMITGAAKSIYQLYAAIAMGQLFQGHRIAGACVSYVGISMAISFVSGVCMLIVNMIVPDDWMYIFNSRADVFSVSYLMFLFLITVVQIILFHVITERILSTKLNLE